MDDEEDLSGETVRLNTLLEQHIANNVDETPTNIRNVNEQINGGSRI